MLQREVTTSFVLKTQFTSFYFHLQHVDFLSHGIDPAVLVCNYTTDSPPYPSLSRGSASGKQETPNAENFLTIFFGHLGESRVTRCSFANVALCARPGNPCQFPSTTWVQTAYHTPRGKKHCSHSSLDLSLQALRAPSHQGALLSILMANNALGNEVSSALSIRNRQPTVP